MRYLKGIDKYGAHNIVHGTYAGKIMFVDVNYSILGKRRTIYDDGNSNFFRFENIHVHSYGDTYGGEKENKRRGRGR